MDYRKRTMTKCDKRTNLVSNGDLVDVGLTYVEPLKLDTHELFRLVWEERMCKIVLREGDKRP